MQFWLHRLYKLRSWLSSLRSKCAGFPKPDFSAAISYVFWPGVTSPNIWLGLSVRCPCLLPSSASSAWPMATRSDGGNGFGVLACTFYCCRANTVFHCKFFGSRNNWLNLIYLFCRIVVANGCALRLLSPVVPAPKHQRELIGFGRSASTPGIKKPSGLGRAGPSAQSCADGIHQ